MADIADDILIQAEQADGTFHCHAFSGVPAARRAWIALVSSGSAQGRALVKELCSELEAVLLGSSPTVTKKEVPSPANPEAMVATGYANRRKVLALVASEDKPLDDLPWYNKWESEKGESAVMTILPPKPFSELVTEAVKQTPNHLLGRVNGSFWKNSVTETLPGILARAEITTAQARVFISYRRVETLPLALQLFDALTHEGFDVFLDRFTIPPGFDFQRRLDQELADKSMVLLLESAHLDVSKWTQHEIDFAKRNRLGLFALGMPDVDPKKRLPAISFDSRKDLNEANFLADPKPVEDPDRKKALSNQWPELKDEVLKEVVGEIKRAHAAALFRRRHRLRVDLVDALCQKNVDAEYTAVGPLRVKANRVEHLLWLATRPPETADFRTLHTAHGVRQAGDESRAILVGPKAALEHERQELLTWLSDVTHCLAYDEGDLAGIAERLAEGRWT
jgi:hypothetical protein